MQGALQLPELKSSDPDRLYRRQVLLHMDAILTDRLLRASSSSRGHSISLHSHHQWDLAARTWGAVQPQALAELTVGLMEEDAIAYLLGEKGPETVTAASEWTGPAVYQHLVRFSAFVTAIYNGKSNANCKVRQSKHLSLARRAKVASRVMRIRAAFPEQAFQGILLVPFPTAGSDWYYISKRTRTSPAAREIRPLKKSKTHSPPSQRPRCCDLRVFPRGRRPLPPMG